MTRHNNTLHQISVSHSDKDPFCTTRLDNDDQMMPTKAVRVDVICVPAKRGIENTTRVHGLTNRKYRTSPGKLVSRVTNSPPITVGMLVTGLHTGTDKLPVDSTW
jgi:hypothetical protein